VGPIKKVAKAMKTQMPNLFTGKDYKGKKG
jgi:hypothetical protein